MKVGKKKRRILERKLAREISKEELEQVFGGAKDRMATIS